MRSLTHALLLLVLFTGSCHAAPLTEDAGLGKTVTLAVKGEALSDIMPMLQAQTGVRLRVSREVADQKATIFVDGRPLKEIMDGLAKLFDYRWTSRTLEGKKYYTISDDPKARKTREDARQKAVQKAWEEIDADLELKAQLATKSRTELENTRRTLDGQVKNAPSKEAQAQLDAVNNLLTYPLNAPCMKIYKSLPPRWLEAVRGGAEVCFDSESNESEWKLSPKLVQELIPAFISSLHFSSELSISEVSMKLSTAADGQGLYASATVGARSTDGGRYSQGFRLSSKSFEEMIGAEKDTLPHEPPSAELLKKISFTTADVALEPGFPWQPATASNPYINRSDLLAILYDKVGLQIISDHYSQWSPMNAAKDVAVSQVLENFLKGRYPPAKWGWDGKFLFMRSPNFRALDAVEVPNRLLRAWKSVVEKQGYLGLEELCQISLLAEQQINSLRTSERYLGLKVNTHSSLTQPILRLYGLLTPRQKREAFSGGTPATAFTPEQQVVLSTILKPDKSDLPVEADLMVGVYKDGVRIDKTESRPAVAQAVATEFEVKERETRSQTSYQASSEGAVTTHISAPTLQEAQQFAAAHGLASSIVQVRVKEIPYQLTLWMSDGTHKESNVSVIPPPERVEPKPK